MLMVLSAPSPAAEPEALLVIHPALSVLPYHRVSNRRPSLVTRLKKLHPSLVSMNKFNTVTGFGMQCLQIYIAARTRNKAVHF
jgi:hypothetical protein